MTQPRRSRPDLMLPPSVAAQWGVTRRTVLRGAAVGGALVGLPGLLSACGGDDEGGGSGDSVTLGMNEVSGPAAQRLRAMARAFTDESGVSVERNEVEHNTFQENVNTYLQGNPDDAFTWFAGFRMNQFAEQGLIQDISDVWPIDGIPEAFKEASTGADGNQYFVPKDYYPWAVFYRRSVFEDNGWEAPQTEAELTELMREMQGKKIVPFAFGDKDGWPAMGTFDILNMRLNGFDFHMALMAGDEAWDSAEVRTVFERWRDLLPFQQEDALGRTWQEAAQALGSGDAGMYLLGTFLVDAIPDVDDLDFFTFPTLVDSIGSDALDAPIDGFCVSAAADNVDNAKEMVGYFGTAEAQDAANEAADAPMIAANDQASTESYSDLQKKSVEVVGAASNIAQFLDRDTRADFAATVVIPSLQDFLRNPGSINEVTTSLQEQKVAIFGS